MTTTRYSMMTFLSKTAGRSKGKAPHHKDSRLYDDVWPKTAGRRQAIGSHIASRRWQRAEATHGSFPDSRSGGMTSKVWLGLLLCSLMVRLSVPDAAAQDAATPENAKPALKCYQCADKAACKTCLSGISTCTQQTCTEGQKCYKKSEGADVTEMSCKECAESDGCCDTALCNGPTSAAVPNRLGGGSMALQVALAAAAILLPLWV
ncbi:uncharacterized protein LOC109512165 [Hippocampus comes]|uniref:uncharacterized protein LOC109512164 n=1 Tax=Hippocampus comes TaxID=109280 RepID=UPI00094F29CC|nr:PREDICTED: uncharacterized protein LOC109512164 [Hippocampus comes]XP_019719260.1 PREDICTED: uncharacterized protein LOC109512165 [Hippocampus comes]